MKENFYKTVIVLGMPRSGTSTIAGILNIFGVEMGRKPVVKELAPKGSYEDNQFARLNRKIFKSALGASGEEWEDSLYWIKLPKREQIISKREEFNEEIKSLVESRNKHMKIWGWKFPVTSLTAELFYPHLRNPYFIIATRDPTEIYRSTLYFFKSVKFKKRISFGIFFKNYLQYYEEIRNFISNKPDLKYLLVPYSDLSSFPRKTAIYIAEFLDIKYSEKQLRRAQKFVIPRNRIVVHKKIAKYRNIILKKLKIFK